MNLLASTENLVSLCSERVRELESLAVIIGQGKEEELVEFSHQLALLEASVSDVADRVHRDAQSIERARQVKAKLDAAAKRLANLDSHLAKHIPPSSPSSSSAASSSSHQHAPPAQQPQHLSEPGPQDPDAPSAALRVPAAAAFETVPRYMRARVTHADVVHVCQVLARQGQPTPEDLSAPGLDAAQVRAAMQCLLRLGHLRAHSPGRFVFV